VATQNYLSGAEALISTLAKGSKAIPNTANNRTRKDRNATRMSPGVGSASELQQGSIAGSN